MLATRSFSLTRDPIAAGLLRFGQLPEQTRLIEFLKSQRKAISSPATGTLSQGSAAGHQFLLATSTTHWAAPIIIRTGDAVMARGGYHGLDPATTPDSLRRMVDQGQVRFAMLNDVLQLSRRLGADQAGSEVTSWIRAQGKLVDPSLWRDATERGDAELYDLRSATP